MAHLDNLDALPKMIDVQRLSRAQIDLLADLERNGPTAWTASYSQVALFHFRFASISSGLNPCLVITPAGRAALEASK